MVFDEKYQFLLDYFGESVIAERYAAWLKEVQMVTNRLGGGDYFIISTDNL